MTGDLSSLTSDTNTRLTALETQAAVSSADFNALERKLFEDIHVQIATKFTQLHGHLRATNASVDDLVADLNDLALELKDTKEFAADVFYYGLRQSASGLSCQVFFCFFRGCE